MAENTSHYKSLPVEPAEVSEGGSDPDNVAATNNPNYQRHPVYSPSEWLFEFTSSILALGLLLGIAIIFWYMDNKPLSAWRGRVSLNATISILTTACATALMHGVSVFISQLKWLYFKNGPHKLMDFEIFDEASRGVWGAVLLLTTVKWNLATIGAFITILRLTFSPFTQQVVLIEQRDVITPADNVTFGYAHNYTRFLTHDLVNADSNGIPQDSGMQSAVYRGLYGITTAEAFSCPGACRWTESYISLGFRTECKNVTEETLRSYSCDAVRGGWRHCNMTTPAGLNLTARQVLTDSATVYNMSVSSLISESILELPETFPEITRFAIYRSTPKFPNYDMLDINVTDCSLFLTVHEYSGARSNGSDFSLLDKREVDFGVKNPWTLSDAPIGAMHEPIYINATTTSDGTQVPKLEIGYANLLALNNFFASATMASEWVEGNYNNRNLGVAAALMGDVPLDTRFAGMATAMTEYLRYGPNTLLARGETIHSEAYVSIRWGYFVVPIVIEGLAILFAVLSVFSNRRSRRVPLWKASALAVLACRHEEQIGLLQGIEKDVNGIQADAGKAAVRLL
ncbi:hypothetical protein BJY00DRAFT_166311 [Aspergillus carlsbadensis]|nr:hypothetical protein BJY00DRAFT_166311 [Aspergillus carlsbadensis]